MDTDEKLR